MKLVKLAAVLIGTTVAGLLVWRKVEADRLENDLWAEAERVSGSGESEKIPAS
ncbi:DLW-39 family protein [Brachybacterium phenoliresistens]|uniref:DLW-39 family protein n=1 Tax=Brachybacterium phenoliresistens TaxID=396014 RepID=UPI0004BB26F8|nr:DLW-39 family protein [Brachybacterium phenoliresistens]